MTRIAVLIAALALALPAAAPAQQNPFGPLPPAAPEPTPTPTPPPGSAADDGGLSTEVLFVMIGGLLVIFTVIGVVITRDARRTLPDDARRDPAPRDQGPHRHERDAKAKARKKTRAQRQARKKTRRR